MKPFYKSVAVEQRDSAYAVMVDQKPFHTPAGNVLLLNHKKIADQIANEFLNQAEQVNPHAMPVTQYAATVVDRVLPRIAEVKREILSYAAGDAICYWAGNPENLRLREKKIWGRLLAICESESMRFNICLSLNRAPQPVESLEILSARLDDISHWRLGLLMLATSMTGSALVSYLWVTGKINCEELFAAGFLPEIYRSEIAGEDAKTSPHLSGKWGDVVFYDGILEFLH